MVQRVISVSRSEFYGLIEGRITWQVSLVWKNRDASSAMLRRSAHRQLDGWPRRFANVD
jgi:hypothetical protein